MRKLILLAILVLGFVVPLAAQMDIPEDTPILELQGAITVEEGVVLLDGVPLVLPEGVDAESLMEGEVLVSAYLLEDDTLLVISIEYVPEDEMDYDEDDVEHPVLSLLADQFETDYDELVELAEELGVGGVTRALILADQMDDVELEDVLALLEDGASWGEVKQTYDIHPSELAPGRVVSGRYDMDDEDVDDMNDMDDDDGRGNGRPDDNPGNGRPDDNPGNGRPDDNPGNGRPDDNPGNGRPDNPGNGRGNGRNK